MKITHSLLGLIFIAAACSDVPTDSIRAPHSAAFDASPASYTWDTTPTDGEPPPPDVDTAYYASGSGGSSARIPVSYFANKTSRAAWVRFTSAKSDARVTYNGGGVKARGIVVTSVNGGTLTIDLSKDLTGGVFTSKCCARLYFKGLLTYPGEPKGTDFYGTLSTAGKRGLGDGDFVVGTH